MRPLCSLVFFLCLTTPPVFAAATEKLDPKVGQTKRDEDRALGPLTNASPEQVRDQLGEPDVARAEGRGAFWTYQLERCALFLFFHDGPNGLRLAGAATGPRQRGDASISVQACLASAGRRSE